VKRIGVYLLILIIVGTNLSLDEFAKVPFLVKHFVSHQQLDPSLTFIRFIEMHYFGQDLQDNDQQQDLKLPFKKVNHGFQQVLLTKVVAFDSFARMAHIKENRSSHRVTFSMSPYFGKIYRPPQVFA